MSRTYRKDPSHLFRHPKTLSELKQRQLEDTDEYKVSQRVRKPPTQYDDITPSSIYQNDHP
jgi:hypothetical protein